MPVSDRNLGHRQQYEARRQVEPEVAKKKRMRRKQKARNKETNVGVEMMCKVLRLFSYQSMVMASETMVKMVLVHPRPIEIVVATKGYPWFQFGRACIDCVRERLTASGDASGTIPCPSL